MCISNKADKDFNLIYLMINIASIIALKLAMTAVYRIISLPMDIKINYEILVLSPWSGGLHNNQYHII